MGMVLIGRERRQIGRKEEDECATGLLTGRRKSSGGDSQVIRGM